MTLHVVCYSGRKADERPLRFELDGQQYLIEKVVNQWYGPDGAFFKVLASDGSLYVLCRHSAALEGEWSLERCSGLAPRG